ncbi:MAG: hypothetical protein ABI675_29755 [Chitinophagaceae bacterium]
MIINSLFRHRQSIAIVMIAVFFADLIGFRFAYAGGGNNDRNFYRSYIDRGGHTTIDRVNNLFNAYSRTVIAGDKGLSIVKSKESATIKKTVSKTRKFIGGPGQPEMQAFQSVGANNLVDLFTGDFSYNIPLLDVGGYPVGLSYRGGASMDEEASWVGLGWNINPGTINRNVRGLPDDFDGKDSITKEQNTRTKWTAGVNVGLEPEIFSKSPKFKNSNPTIGIYYDNYTGPGYNLSVTPGLASGQFALGDKTYGVGNLSLGLSFDSQSGFNVNPTYAVKIKSTESLFEKGEGSIGLNYNSRAGLQDLQISGNVRTTAKMKANKGAFTANQTSLPLFSSSISFAGNTFTPSISMPSTFAGFTFRVKAGGQIFGFHPLAAIGGNYSQSFIAPADRVQKLPAYGYLHLSKSENDQKALMDFNREKDIPFRDNTPNIAIPLQTYDVFSISGEGIGGSFRAYRGDVGVMRDHQVKNNSTSANFGADFGGVPNVADFGADVRFTVATTVSGQWAGSSNVVKRNLAFKSSDSTYESVYFRNPGEQSSNTAEYYNSIGDEDLVRVNLKGGNYDPIASNFLERFDRYGQQSTLQLTKPIAKTSRDKRNQVISYLNAAEASIAGLEKEIRSYPVNVFPLGSCDTTLYKKISRNDGTTRKANHISEITVLNPDGRSYVYGIPAYNLKQQEITFAVDKAGAETSKGLVGYSGNDTTQKNTKGKDGYFSKQTTPAYAHSYLLTALKSPDYVDVTGNGITDDDMGDAVKFNYTMKWGADTAFRWRTPTDSTKANYDEGLRTDNSDDKGHIVYGEKEIWYLNSIESKTMIATFILDSAVANLRKDGFEVKNSNGGRSTSTTKKLIRLKEINLYSKADLKKYGATARPIKTVNFSYSYRLCKGYPDLQDTATGKLTLESVWFTYNKNAKGQRNKYLFTYGNNPNYQYKAYDRWGNYKPASDNPGGLTSDEYPYALKDSTLAGANAAAWNLSEIVLPSGAKMKVQYESDDYGYVQNKRSNEMFQIAGFGETSNGTYDNSLYTPPTLLSSAKDRPYVYIKVSSKITSKQEVFDKYLAEQNKLYFRLHVKMPGDGYGSGSEYIPVYAAYTNYGLVNDSTIWVQLENSPEGNGKSPLVTAAIQFLRLNLPSKAYPGSDVRNDPAFRAAIMAVLSIVKETKTLLMGGFNNAARKTSRSKETMLSRSFVRLSTPVFKKYGGGYRVKKISIYDNWQKMAGNKESVYGQEYRYTTTKVIGGKKKTISSGVASYEPSLGNEENPFHQPVEYKEKVTLAPSNFMYVEEPFAESLFPSAGVGYSKVRVSSINRKNIKSAPGFEETEFYTAYDFPTLTQFSPFDKEKSYKKGIDKFNPFKINVKKFITLSQGFKIELNDMHGKMKSNAVYAETDSTQPITYTAQYYRAEKITGESYRLINTVPVIDSANGKINMQGQIGKDIELVTDMREQYSQVVAPGLNFDNSFFIIPAVFVPIPLNIPSVSPELRTEKSRFRSVSMLKIIQRYGILDSVVHIDKGSKVSTHNVAWDGETGEVLLTQTQNEFNDPVYQFNYPAHWGYSGAGLAYKNIDAVFNNVCIAGGKVTKVNGNSTDKDIISRICESGDEVLVLNKATTHIWEGCLYPNTTDRPSKISKERKLWVVDKAKVSGGAKELYFIDRNGSEYSGHAVNLRIIRSGRRNMASTPVGSVVSLKSPIKTVSGVTRIVIDSTIDVISAGAAVMKDVWSVEDRLYKVMGCDSTNKIVDTTIKTYSTGLVKRSIKSTGTSTLDEIESGTDMSSGLFVASRHINAFLYGGTPYRLDRRTRGLIKFNLGFIPDYATVDSAALKLFSKAPRYMWPGVSYWDAVTYAHTRYINQSELLQVIKPWNASTKYKETDNMVTDSNKVILSASTDSCQDYLVNVKNMVQYMVNEPETNEGMLLRLSTDTAWTKLNSFVPVNNLVNHMSFCATGVATRSLYSIPPGGCTSCSSIELAIKYHYRKDSCYSSCKSIFDNKINPYVQGIWGNWRGWRSYVYYDNRKQTDPAVQTNIRTDGVISNFIPYWTMGSTAITPSASETVWVWNSEITRYNRRGLETENHDPLGRFNSGLYGYNNTLPVAVTQNARHRETAFDGFEDYGFATDNCVVDCPLLRHFDFSTYKDSITTTQKHSGKSSLRVGASSNAQISIKVKPGTDSLAPAMSFNTYGHAGCTFFNKIQTSSGAVYPGFTPLPGKLMVVSAWVKEDKDCKCLTYTGNAIEFKFYQAGSLINTVSKSPAGNIIEGWQRYEDTLQIPSAADSMTVKLRNTTTVPVYFDDLRLFPHNSNMKSFVYHPTSLRLLAELDENNYASFYEYDDEGSLIRVKKETERGIKTISETRSALRKTDE